MKQKNILVSISGHDSEHGKIDVACDYAREMDAQLTFIHVNDPNAGKGSLAFVDHGMRFDEETLRHYVERRAEDRLCEHVRYVVTEGDWVDVLPHLCEKQDLLVLGHHHLNWFQRVFGEDLCETVINTVQCPVITVDED